MIRLLPRFLLLAACLLAMVCATAPAVHAQRTDPPGAPGARPTRTPVTLVLVDSLAGGAPFQIVRRGNGAHLDVILFPAGADSATLSVAVRQLLLLRRAQGDIANVGRVRVRHATAPDRRPRTLPWAPRVMNDLHRAERKQVPGVGSVPAVQIWLPSQRRSGK